ncbi:polysaccharide biosynthesis C-terminal domain-containing protein [Aliiroseovarius crassostreae]|uniref:oligosaccharide flippase family protein n=1 Tax=Aliiroseovarius crassostreae TaxID=154981 RepID=UPI003C7A00EE
MTALLAQLGRLMSLRMFAIGLTFLQTIALTRVFGGEVFGLLSVGLSVSALLVLILSFGLDQVAMRDIAMEGVSHVAATRRWAILWQLIRRVVMPVTMMVVAVGTGLLVLTTLGGPYQVTLIGALLLLPVMLARKYLESFSLGAKQVARSIIGSQIAYPLLMILGAVWVWRMGMGSSASNITATYAAAGIGSFLVALILARPTLVLLRPGPDMPHVAPPAPTPRAMMTSGGHFALISLGFVLGQHVDVLMTGILSSPEDAALVRIASRVAEMAGLMRMIVVLQYKPLLAEAHGARDKAGQMRHIRSMTLLFLATGTPIALALVVFAEPAMAIFGSEFVAGAPALRLFVAGVFISLLMGPSSTLLSLSGHEHLASRNLMIAILIQVLLNLFLIPRFGALGCGMASFTAIGVLAFLSGLACYRHLGIDPTILGLLRPASATVQPK